jgi:hypothetical protein
VALFVNAKYFGTLHNQSVFRLMGEYMGARIGMPGARQELPVHADFAARFCRAPCGDDL